MAEDNPFKKFESRFGLRRTSGDKPRPGVHSRTSYHYRPAVWGGVQAYDYGTSVNSKARLVAAGTLLMLLAKVGKGYRGRRIREAFGPFPFYVKDGKVYKGQFPNHGDHLHVAFTI